MKGAKGECTFFQDGEMVHKTKFDTQKNCNDRIGTLLRLGVTDIETTSYKCKRCGFWHLGKPVQAEKFGI